MIENTFNLRKVGKRDKSDLVRCSTTLLFFPWNSILGQRVRKFSMKNEKKMGDILPNLISFWIFIKHHYRSKLLNLGYFSFKVITIEDTLIDFFLGHAGP